MYKKITLKSGLRIITHPLRETKAVTVLILFKVGSRYESTNINGISHFIEHLMFKGTRKRPSTLAISQELDSVGAIYNAFTAKDFTGYFIKINYENFEQAMDLLSDMLYNSVFRLSDINKERGVITEEINLYEDNPMFYVGDLFEQTIFGENSLGRLIIGTKKNIKFISRQQILHYIKEHYLPANTVISIAGKIRHSDIKLIKKYFHKINQPSQATEFPPIKIKQTSPRVNILYKKTEQVHLCLGVHAFSYFHPDIYALYVLDTIFGANMSSRLFDKIRVQKSLAYLIRSSANVYEDTGNFHVHAGLDKARIFEAIESILEELKKIRDKGVTKAELNKAKAYLKGQIVLELEDSQNIAQWYGQQELLQKKTLTPEQKIAKIQKVTSADVLRVARSIIRADQLNLALIGPFQDRQKFLDLLKF
jgi:predicted Zn-dependent peptidase